MSIKIRDGVMVVLAAGGVLALAGTAEFGIPAAVIGAGISALSGAMAFQRVGTGESEKAGRIDSKHKQKLA